MYTHTKKKKKQQKKKKTISDDNEQKNLSGMKVIQVHEWFKKLCNNICF